MALIKTILTNLPIKEQIKTLRNNNWQGLISKFSARIFNQKINPKFIKLKRRKL